MKFKKMLMTLMMCLMMVFAVPAVTSQASAPVQTEAQASETAAPAAENEEESFMLIMMMGGGLLIILFAVITAMSTFAGAVAVAANMDVDGE